MLGGKGLGGDFFILLNVAGGGSGPSSPDATTSFPPPMTVNYVRSAAECLGLLFRRVTKSAGNKFPNGAVACSRGRTKVSMLSTRRFVQLLTAWFNEPDMIGGYV